MPTFSLNLCDFLNKLGIEVWLHMTERFNHYKTIQTWWLLVLILILFNLLVFVSWPFQEKAFYLDIKIPGYKVLQNVEKSDAAHIFLHSISQLFLWIHVHTLKALLNLHINSYIHSKETKPFKSTLRDGKGDH